MMNRICRLGLTGLFFMAVHLGSHGQSTDTPKAITPYIISVAYNKTTNLIFPYAIKSVDRGSSAVMVQKAKAVNNILQVKAGKKNFEQTNLSVVTADGAFYSFVLDYAIEPSYLNIRFEKSELPPPAELNGQASEQVMEQEAGQVMVSPSFMRIRHTEQQITIGLQGIVLAGDRLWFKLQCMNRSVIDFRPDLVRFVLDDKKKVKRTAIQQTELFPAYSTMPETIAGNDEQIVAIAFDPFTVPGNQRLVIQVGELGNGRMISLRVKSKWLLRARRL